MIMNNNDLDIKILSKLMDKNTVIGLTSGCYDLLHHMHLQYLKRCKSQCDILIVGVDADLLVYSNKNKYPEIPEHHRVNMVDNLKCVDITFPMNSIKDFTDLYPYVNKVFKNSDTIYGKKIVIDGPELVIIPDIVETTSTSELVAKIKNEK